MARGATLPQSIAHSSGHPSEAPLNMRHSRLRVALAAITVLALLPVAAAPAMARDSAKTEHERIVAHWTKERIANAIPRDFVKAGGGLKAVQGSKGKPPPPASGGA